MPRLHSLLVLLLLLCAAPAGAQGAAVDQSAWDRLLRAHVSGGMVDYDAFGRAPEFARYLASLDRVDPAALPRAERLAFWINTYNAFTIQLINQHGERRSIRNINRTLGVVRGSGPWSERMVRAGGKVYTLDDVEQRIIRPEFGEPRIHFALVCAAKGCPPLRSEAYTGARLEAQLDDQARVFLLRSPAKNRVEVASRTVYASEIFRFRDYAKDFGGSREAIGRYIARFHPDGPAKQLLLSGDFRLSYTPYDWSLNAR
jgi:hypothetical protein